MPTVSISPPAPQYARPADTCRPPIVRSPSAKPNSGAQAYPFGGDGRRKPGVISPERPLDDPCGRLSGGGGQEYRYGNQQPSAAGPPTLLAHPRRALLGADGAR